MGNNRRLFLERCAAFFLVLFAPGALFGKKKKKPKQWIPDQQDKDGVLQDTNQDGILENFVPLYQVDGTWGSAVGATCCDCGLHHTIQMAVTRDMIGYPSLFMRWTRDDRRTHMERIKKFGPNYTSGRDNIRGSTFGPIGREEW